MNASAFPIRSWVVLSCIAVLAACGSSAGKKADGPPAGEDAMDAAMDMAMDVGGEHSLSPEDAPPFAIDGPLAIVDAPTASNDGYGAVMDTPPGLMDGDPVIDGGRNVDANFLALPDGRLLEEVDYCLPIGPLPTEFGHYPSGCPATVDDAITDEQSPADARYPWADAPDIYRCSEGAFAYFAYNLGGIACFYGPESRQLISVVYYTDTLQPCNDLVSVSFNYVYGQRVKCTAPTSVTVVDAGAGQ